MGGVNWDTTCVRAPRGQAQARRPTGGREHDSLNATPGGCIAAERCRSRIGVLCNPLGAWVAAQHQVSHEHAPWSAALD